jgi:hypothetical protein
VNRILLASLRLGLHALWIIPIVWLYSGQAQAPIGPIPSVLPVLAVAVACSLGLMAMTESGASLRSWKGRLGLCALVLLAVVAAVFFASLGSMNTDVNGVSALVILLLVMVCWIAYVTRRAGTYQGVVSAFGFGVVMLLLWLGIYAGFVGGSNHLKPLSYLGIVAYTIGGVVALAFARRFSSDEAGPRRRKAHLEPGWVQAVAVIGVGLAVVSLILIQIFVLDIAGAVGSLFTPVRDAISNVLIGGLVDMFKGGLHLIGLYHPSSGHHIAHHPNPKDKGGGKGRTIYGHPNQGNPVVENIVKIVMVVVVGIVALAATIVLLNQKPDVVTSQAVDDEERSSAWSTGATLNWFLRRAKQELAGLVPSRPHGFRRPRMRTVRDVYRAFLEVGQTRIRPRKIGETGLEYSSSVVTVLSTTRPALDELNTLYMEERYGSRQMTDEHLAAAIRDFEAFDGAAAAAPEPVATGSGA